MLRPGGRLIPHTHSRRRTEGERHRRNSVRPRKRMEMSAQKGEKDRLGQGRQKEKAMRYWRTGAGSGGKKSGEKLAALP